MKNKPRILLVVGTRPNFIKVTRFTHENKQMGNPFDIQIVHTGQHYDSKMADVFFEQFELKPDHFLNISPGSPTSQMADIMLSLEKLLQQITPDLVCVVGDVNSTFAAAYTAHKCGIKLAHIESGLRSFDRGMPEEINRILTDEISDYFFVTEPSGTINLLKENKSKDVIVEVGNTMIDTLVAFETKIQSSSICDLLQIQKGNFVLTTMHRPATVDSKEGMQQMIDVFNLICKSYPLVFPIHPRTIKKAEEFGLSNQLRNNKNLILCEPLDYFAFQKLISDCCFVITDSGGIQEETTFRKKPCLTLRPNTERPITTTMGSNTLVPFDHEIISTHIEEIKSGSYKQGAIPFDWDGKSTFRILEYCKQILKEDLN